ncbi:hypothetical protein ACLBR5_27405 [Escherichia coli]
MRSRLCQPWADAEWFLNTPRRCAERPTVTVFKVTGETNTDDLSPAPDAWSRPDIPLHALAMLKNAREGMTRPAWCCWSDQANRSSATERFPAGVRR